MEAQEIITAEAGTVALLNKSEIDMQVATAHKYPRSVKRFRDETLAMVTLNGKTFPTLWTYPYQVDITGTVQPGTNSLRVEIINSWHNRLVGDARLPQGKRSTSLTHDPFKAGDPLQPAGLFGPVRLISSQ